MRGRIANQFARPILTVMLENIAGLLTKTTAEASPREPISIPFNPMSVVDAALANWMRDRSAASLVLGNVQSQASHVMPFTPITVGLSTPKKIIPRPLKPQPQPAQPPPARLPLGQP